jgi:hypothetical protein
LLRLTHSLNTYVASSDGYIYSISRHSTRNLPLCHDTLLFHPYMTSKNRPKARISKHISPQSIQPKYDSGIVTSKDIAPRQLISVPCINISEEILSKLKSDFEELMENINALVCDASSTVGINRPRRFLTGSQSPRKIL